MAVEKYQVIRPEDGAEVTLTCTPEQFEEHWAPRGYVKVPGMQSEEVALPEQPSEAIPEPPTPPKRSRAATRAEVEPEAEESDAASV